jgi:PAS domain S-box-containing protein
METTATVPDSRKRVRVLRLWTPYVILASTLLLTAVVAYSAKASADARARLRFEAAAQRASDAVTGRVDTYVAMLLSGTGLFAASQYVDRGEFHAFVERLDLRGRYPGIQGMGYTAYVKRAERDAFIARIRDEGAPGFTLRPEGERPEQYPVVYIEPFDEQNRGAVGFDVSSEPVRHAAMERARDSGLPTASGPVNLMDGAQSETHAGFLIYVPVYRNGSPRGTVAERQAGLAGFIYSPFRASQLLDRALADEPLAAFEIDVFDGVSLAPETLLHSEGHSEAPAGGPRELSQISTIQIAGRTWSVVATAGPAFDGGGGQWAVPGIAIAGGAIGLILFSVFRLQVRARTLAEQTAAELSRSERSLRDSEQHARDVLDGLFTFVGVMKPDGELLQANRAMLEAASLAPQDVLQKPLEETYWWAHSDESKSELRAAIERAAKGEVVRYDARMRLAEGKLITVDLAITPLRDAAGKVSHLIPSGTDISDRLAAEEGRARLNEEIIGMQAARLAELSTPLIPLGKSIVLMPLIGAMDAARARQVVEAVAAGVASRRARVALIDITGVPTIDASVAGLLMQAAQVARILGAEVVLTGINPAVAQAMVRIGTDLGGVVTRGDLQSGIDYAMGLFRRDRPSIS